jgi:flagellar motor protein MotB
MDVQYYTKTMRSVSIVSMCIALLCVAPFLIIQSENKVKQDFTEGIINNFLVGNYFQEEKAEVQLDSWDKIRDLNEELIVEQNESFEVEMTAESLLLRLMNFPIGAEKPTLESERLLEQIGAAIKKHLPQVGYQISVTGHTDSTPSITITNWALSLGRARQTRKALMRAGIDENSISFAGEGFVKPIADEEESIEARKRNRRVEILIIPQMEGTSIAGK